LKFAVLAAEGCIGQDPHTGVPEIVTCPMQPPTDCEQYSIFLIDLHRAINFALVELFT
jgi:hypothetical protein